MNYSAQPKQLLFHFAEGREVFYGGAAGGGKSYAIIWDAVNFCVTNKGVRAAIFRRTYPELEKSIIFDFLANVPEKLYKYNKQDHKVIFKDTKSVLEFNHCQYESDVFKFQSAQYQRVYFDELTHFTEFQYKYLRSRLRAPKHKNLVTQTKSASNPGGVGHLWVYERFIQDTIPNKVVEKTDEETGTKYTIQFIPSKVYDNQILMDNDPEYINNLMLLPTDERKALLEGDWDSFKGQFFKEWRRDVHVVAPFTIPTGWRIFRAFDWGYTNPFCMLWLAMDFDGNIYVFRELYGTQMVVDKLSIEVKRLSGREEIQYTIADPSLWSISQYEKGESIAMQFIAQKIPMIKADNDRMGGAQNVHQYLQIDKKTQKPRLFIFETCFNLIRTLPKLVHDDKKPEDVNTQGEDHCLTGDTKVLTDKGWVEIKDLPFAKITGYDRIVMEIETESGKKLKCTTNHKILTPDGWILAGSLQRGDKILSLYPKQFKSLMEKGITDADFTIKEKVKDFTELFGNFQTAKFQEHTTSTTKMEIDQTTDSKTSNLLKSLATLVYTPQIQQKNRLKQEEKMLDSLQLVIKNLLKNKEVEQVKWVGLDAKKQDVYDIGIEHPLHAFIVNGGLIVHNCYDALRYGLMAHPLSPILTTSNHIKRNSFEGQMQRIKKSKSKEGYVGSL